MTTQSAKPRIERKVNASSPDALRRMIAAGMLGTAIFLVEAGAAELILRADRLCQAIRLTTWSFNPRGCQPEVVSLFLRGLTRGVVGAIRPEISPLLGVATMAVAMGLLAALLGVLPLRRAVPAFLALQMAAAIAFGFLAYFLLFVG
jgi:hypothetical protein